MILCANLHTKIRQRGKKYVASISLRIASRSSAIFRTTIKVGSLSECGVASGKKKPCNLLKVYSQENFALQIWWEIRWMKTATIFFPERLYWIQLNKFQGYLRDTFLWRSFLGMQDKGS